MQQGDEAQHGVTQHAVCSGGPVAPCWWVLGGGAVPSPRSHATKQVKDLQEHNPFPGLGAVEVVFRQV